MDGGSSDTGGEPEGTRLGLGAEGAERQSQALERKRLEDAGHTIVEKDGHLFYEITLYGKKGPWKDYQPVVGSWSGNGSRDFADPAHQAKAQLGRQSAMERKARRAADYEDKIYEQLDNVAKLQSYIVSAALDSGAELDRTEMEKLRLGLQAAESLLNRALGKAVTKVDMDVTHSVADDIATIEAEWTIDE